MSETETEYFDRIDRKLEEMRHGHYKRFATAYRMTCIVEIDGVFEVHDHSLTGIAPPSSYNSKRQAVARVLQLLGTGVVAPQTWPESVCIGEVNAKPETESA